MPKCDSVDLLWQPLHLLTGRVEIRRLALDGVRIRDDSPPSGKPVDLSWPRLSGFAELVEVAIARLQVSELSYRRLSGAPVIVTAFSSSVDWGNSLLSLGDIRASSPSGGMAGHIFAGFHRPSLQLSLMVSPPHAVAGMDLFSVQTRLIQGRSPEQLAGSIMVSGTAGKKRLLDLAGEIGVTRDAFNLRRLRLSSPVRRGTITADGMVSLARKEPFLDVQLALAGLDLSDDLHVTTDLSGTLSLAGNRNRYHGRFSLANRGTGWHSARLAGAYEGTGAGLKLSELTGSLLEGSLLGHLDVAWHKGLSVAGTLNGRNLNPAVLAPDWTGEVNFDATGSVARSGQAPLHGELRGTLLAKPPPRPAADGNRTGTVCRQRSYARPAGAGGKRFHGACLRRAESADCPGPGGKRSFPAGSGQRRGTRRRRLGALA